MSILNDLGSTSTNLRDRAHATKIFVDGNYNLAPKYSFLYYVHIESTVSDKSKNIGMLVKSASLPKFSIDVEESNGYNRIIYTQTRIKYDPVNIVFHDDNANTVRDFWKEYFTYYYRDHDNTETSYAAMASTRYDLDRQFNKWGYTPRQDDQFLKKITIYSLHKKRFSAYSLMNPMIKSFQHGEHQAGQSETMQNSMTVVYESVLYSEGKVVEDTIPGFLDLRYDKHPSPLTPAGGGTASILGEGGLLETAGEIGADIEQGNIGSAIFKGIQGIQNLGKMDLKQAAVGELFDIGKNILRGNDVTKNIFVPSLSGSSDNKLGGLLNIGNTLKQGISSASGWLSSASSIGSLAKSGLNRINQEVTDATSFLTKSAPKNFTSALSGIGSLLPFGKAALTSAQLQTLDLLANDIDKLQLDNTNLDLGNDIPLNQAAQVKAPIQQVSMNESRLKVNLQYNRNNAQQNKINLQIEINNFKEQQQMAQDAINNLIVKRNSLNENTNSLLIKQLTLQIDQQQMSIETLDQNITNSQVLVEKLDEKIKFLDARLLGTI